MYLANSSLMGESDVAVDVVIALGFFPEPRIDAPLATAISWEKERRQSRQTGGFGRLGHGTSHGLQGGTNSHGGVEVWWP